MDYEEIFARHERIALQFSGGKDSLAVLYLLRPYLDKLTVYFCNSGDAFPETLELIEGVKQFIPHFVEVQGRQPEVLSQMGWPSDLVTCGSTSFGRMMGHEDPALIDRYTCCFYSLMQPMYVRMKQDGITLVIRGQKNDDDKKPPLRSGETLNGFEFLYPIEHWNSDDIFAFLKKEGSPIPRYYADGMTSAPDCMNCTAWLEHSLVAYTKRYHPQQHPILLRRLNIIKKAVDAEHDKLTRTIKEATGNGI
jgi:phosphoadenosine phosphosulfate reductase